MEEAEGLDPMGPTSKVGPPGILNKSNFSGFHSFLSLMGALVDSLPSIC